MMHFSSAYAAIIEQLASLGVKPQYYTQLKKMNGRYPIPEPLKLDQLDAFLAQAGDCYSVRWLEVPTISLT